MPDTTKASDLIDASWEQTRKDIAWCLWEESNGCVEFDDYDFNDEGADAAEYLEDPISLSEYGLEFAWCPPHEHYQGHYAYVLTTGGPQVEIQFYANSDLVDCWRIEYYYRWSGEARINVTNDEVAIALWDYFKEILPSKD